jgi:hypothetical protein
MSYNHITQKQARATRNELDNLKRTVSNRWGSRIGKGEHMSSDNSPVVRTAMELGYTVMLRRREGAEFYDLIAVKP